VACVDTLDISTYYSTMTKRHQRGVMSFADRLESGEALLRLDGETLESDRTHGGWVVVKSQSWKRSSNRVFELAGTGTDWRGSGRPCVTQMFVDKHSMSDIACYNTGSRRYPSIAQIVVKNVLTTGDHSSKKVEERGSYWEKKE
jgi:hypothetical protein